MVHSTPYVRLASSCKSNPIQPTHQYATMCNNEFGQKYNKQQMFFHPYFFLYPSAGVEGVEEEKEEEEEVVVVVVEVDTQDQVTEVTVKREDKDDDNDDGEDQEDHMKNVVEVVVEEEGREEEEDDDNDNDDAAFVIKEEARNTVTLTQYDQLGNNKSARTLFYLINFIS